MSNVLSEEKKQQVIALGRLGWSLRRIERAAHIRRETAGTYLRAAGIAVRPPGGWGRSAAKPAIEVSTDSEAWRKAASANQAATSAASSPAELRTGRSLKPNWQRVANAMAIWQDLVDGHGFAGRYASVKRASCRSLCGSSSPEARVVIETAPGEEAQVDYGTRPHSMVRDPQSGKYRRTRLCS